MFLGTRQWWGEEREPRSPQTLPAGSLWTVETIRSRPERDSQIEGLDWVVALQFVLKSIEKVVLRFR